MDNIFLALKLTGFGMGAVFGVLMLFYGTIILSNKLFPNKEQ